jgi:hypothetical protein
MMFNFTLLSMVTVLFGNIATMILHFLYVFYDLLMDSGQCPVWLNSNGPWCSGFVSTANRKPVARFLSFSMAPAASREMRRSAGDGAAYMQHVPPPY